MPFLTDLKYVYWKNDGSRKKYRLTAPLKYRSNRISQDPEFIDVIEGGMITVPVGFDTDFATIPWPISLIIKPDGKRWKAPAVLHDYLTREALGLSAHRYDGLLTRKVADDLFHEALRSEGLNRLWAFWFWVYVRCWSIVNTTLKDDED